MTNALHTEITNRQNFRSNEIEANEVNRQLVIYEKKSYPLINITYLEAIHCQIPLIMVIDWKFD